MEKALFLSQIEIKREYVWNGNMAIYSKNSFFLIFSITTVVLHFFQHVIANNIDVVESTDGFIEVTKMLTKKGETPYTVEVFNEKDIKNSGARHLYEFLNQMSGFQWLESSFTEAAGGIRNFVANQQERILLLIDGRPTSFISYEHFFAGRELPINNIRKVEIIKGPASSLYGSNALNGVINIVTRSGLRKLISCEIEEKCEYGENKFKEVEGIEVSASYESFSTKEQSLFFAKKFGNINTSFNIAHYSTNGPGLVPELEDNTDKQNFDFLSKFEISKWTLELGHTVGESGILFSPIRGKDRGSRKKSSAYLIYDDKNHNQLYDDTSSSNTIPRLRASVYINDFEMETISEAIDMSTLTPLNVLTKVPERNIGGNIQYDYKIKSHNSNKIINNFLVGAEFNIKSVELRQNILEKNVVAAFIQNDYFPLERLTLTTGFRFDKDAEFGNNFSPNIGIIYRFKDDRTRIRAYYSESFRVPDFMERFGDGNITTFGFLKILGNSDIMPEKLRALEFGIDHTLINNNLYKIAGGFRIFNNFLKDRIDPIPIKFENLLGTSIPTEIQYHNLGDLSINGFETEVKANYKKLFHGYANYTYLDLNEIERFAKHKFNIGLTTNYREKIITTIRASMRYKNNFFNVVTGARGFSDRSFLQVDLNTQINLLKDLNLTIAGYNILDDEYGIYEGGFPQTGRSYAIKLEYKYEF